MTSHNSTTTTALAANATAIARWWSCADGLPQGTWCDYYPAGQPASAPSTHLLGNTSRIIGYSLTAFLVLRMLTRTSTSALIGLCLIIGGLFYDMSLGVPIAEAAVTDVVTSTMAALHTTITSGADLITLPTFHAKDGTPYVLGPPAPGDPLNLYPGGPYGPSKSLAGRFASSTFLWICTIVVCVFLVQVTAYFQDDSSSGHHSSTETARIDDGHHITPSAVESTTASASRKEILTTYRGSDGRLASQRNEDKRTNLPTPHEDEAWILESDDTAVDGHRISRTVATSTTAGTEDEGDYMTIYRPNAGRLLVEHKKIKRTEAPAQQAKSIAKTDNTEAGPGSMKMTLLLAMLLLTALMVPMAFAEPISTSMPASTLSLPSNLPCSPLHDATATVLYPNPTLLDLQKKDPQSWVYNNPGAQRQAHPLWLLVPLVLIGNFLLPTLATLAAARWLSSEPLMGATVTERQTSTSSTTDLALKAHAAADLQKRAAQGQPDPIWVTSYTTTTTYLPTVTVTAPPDPAIDPAATMIGAAGDAWQPAPVGIEGICTERNLAVCPIVLGRKGWEPPVSVGPPKNMSKVALLVLVACLAAVAVAKTDYPVYLPVETVEATKAVSPAIEPRVAVDDGSKPILIGTPLQHYTTEQGIPSATVIQQPDNELWVRDSRTGTSNCEELSSLTTTSTSTTSNIIAAGQHWAVNGSMESGVDAESGFARVAIRSCAFAAGIASGFCLMHPWYWFCV